jgi:hypothetical protein
VQGPQGPQGATGTFSATDRAELVATFTGVTRACASGRGTATFDGVAWGACIESSGYCTDTSRPGCSAATASTSCKTLRATAGFAGGDGQYYITAGGTAFEAWCDMTTEGGGWTRVFVVNAPATTCVMGAGATGDPSTLMYCGKYTDAIINTLATERIFYTRTGANPPLFTKYTGQLSSAVNAYTTIGNIVNKETYAAVMAAATVGPPGYSGFRLFSQHNWYQADTQLGSKPRMCRVSLEYIDDGTRPKYSCCGASCEVANPSRIDYGTIVAFVK